MPQGPECMGLGHFPDWRDTSVWRKRNSLCAKVVLLGTSAQTSSTWHEVGLNLCRKRCGSLAMECVVATEEQLSISWERIRSVSSFSFLLSSFPPSSLWLWTSVVCAGCSSGVASTTVVILVRVVGGIGCLSQALPTVQQQQTRKCDESPYSS